MLNEKAKKPVERFKESLSEYYSAKDKMMTYSKMLKKLKEDN